MSRRVHFSEGEGVTHGDMNAMGQLAERDFLDEMRWIHGAASSGNAFPHLRYDLTGTGSRTFNIKDGATGVALYTSPGAEDSTGVVVKTRGTTALTLDANTDGSSWRRDIIEATIVQPAAGESESRNFEDAATRALSSASTNKRFRATMTFQIKKGTDQASEAAADANEPTPTGGFEKVYSILVDNTGAVDKTKIKAYYKPSSGVIDNVAYMQTGIELTPALPIVAVAGIDATWTNTAGTLALRIDNQSGSSRAVSFRAIIPTFYTKAGGMPHSYRRITDLVIKYNMEASGFSAFIKRLDPIGATTTTVLDITSQLTADDTIRSTTINLSTVLPLWGNGYPNPLMAGDVPGHRLMVELNQASLANGSASTLYYVLWNWYGG